MNSASTRISVALAIALGALLLAGSFALAIPSMTRDQIICRAKSGLGYSYWWGGSCWCKSGCGPSNCGKGNCSCSCGSCCPGCCSHSGSKGADCSGYTYTCWRIAGLSDNNVCGPHGPASGSYTVSGSNWTVIPDGSRKKGDSVAKSGHVMVFDKNASWGKIWVYEAKGCNYGVVHNTRSVSWGSWTVAKRKSLVEGECSPGQQQSAGCGKCGTKKRTCSSNGNWGSWGGCSGQGPCSPGQTQNQACGNCGNKKRTCKSNCQWGGWGGCGGQGECSPGQTQEQGCGNCGTKTRGCGGNCKWGGWGQCLGQGPCAPGQSQTEACGDCGTHSRGCGGNCQWQGWGECDGPDPEGGNKWCDSGELGVCAEGRVRCLKGWLACVRLYDPSPEICDGLDNDCQGEVDQGSPQQMGVPPPPFAAQLVDLSYPPLLKPGERGKAWGQFRNVGTQPWPAEEVWLAAVNLNEEASPLYTPGGWPAWNVPATLQDEIQPGETGVLEFEICAPESLGPLPDVRFRLLAPDGTPINCPSPELNVSLEIMGATLVASDAGSVLSDSISEPLHSLGAGHDPEEPSPGGCGTGPAAAPIGGAAFALLLLCAALRRKLSRDENSP